MKSYDFIISAVGGEMIFLKINNFLATSIFLTLLKAFCWFKNIFIQNIVIYVTLLNRADKNGFYGKLFLFSLNVKSYST